MKNIIFVINRMMLLLLIPINIQPQNPSSAQTHYYINDNASAPSKPLNVESAYNGFQNFEIHEITDIATGYDYQSNSSPQQIWVDLNNPNYIHAVFTNSQETVFWGDRTSYYFGSTDAGTNWFHLGGVPVNTGTSGRSGFPTISGTSSGKAVIMNHNNAQNQTTLSKVYIDGSTFEYNFTEYDPGDFTSGSPVYPRFVVASNGHIIFLSSLTLTSPTHLLMNSLNPVNGNFSGWLEIEGDPLETYSFSRSNNGKIGLVIKGMNGVNGGDVFYTESTDNGITWTIPLKIFDCPAEQGIAVGVMRGININFFNEEPCVVFETCLQDFNTGTYYPDIPNQILFWSPNVNSGIPKVIVDSTNTPFAPSRGTDDKFLPVCRPVLGRSQNFGYLFLAFSVATANVWPAQDSTTYFAGYFMYSSNGGNSWSYPEKFTPDQPIYDWRYISIAQVNPTFNNDCIVHMVAQADSIPGSTVFVVNMPVGVTARYYHISAGFMDIPVELISFEGDINNNQVVLKWTTATELNNSGFEIERQSETKIDWQNIAFVPGFGTSTETHTYSFTDNDVAIGKYFYRLKQIDFDGNYEYSKIVEVDVVQPFVFTLEQNYPNPFNPSTKIKYQIPVGGFVSLKVYDVLGTEVATLVNEEKPAGSYELQFDASEFPSGIYFYTLKAGDFSQTKKMILLK